MMGICALTVEWKIPPLRGVKRACFSFVNRVGYRDGGEDGRGTHQEAEGGTWTDPTGAGRGAWRVSGRSARVGVRPCQPDAFP